MEDSIVFLDVLFRIDDIHACDSARPPDRVTGKGIGFLRFVGNGYGNVGLILSRMRILVGNIGTPVEVSDFLETLVFGVVFQVVEIGLQIMKRNNEFFSTSDTSSSVAVKMKSPTNTRRTIIDPKIQARLIRVIFNQFGIYRLPLKLVRSSSALLDLSSI